MLMELYFIVTVTDRRKSGKMSLLCSSLGLPMVNVSLGYGTASDTIRSYYGLSSSEKAVITAVASAAEAKELFRLAKKDLFIDIPGNGIIMSIPVKSVAGTSSLSRLTNSTDSGGTPDMDFRYELIIAILNEGYADDVMDAARSAGAGGGTVLHAKGTGPVKSESFFGISLADEKDLLLIVASAKDKGTIMQAIQTHAGPGTKPGAVCFSLPISAVAGLRENIEG